MIRTPASLAELTKTAAQDGVVFAGALSGGYVFPEFLPAYDAIASLCKLLELLAHESRPVSELVGELPESTLVHRHLPCPWSLKGLVMHVVAERLKGRELDLVDGVKLFTDRGWAQVLPIPTSQRSTSTPRDRPNRTPGSSKRSCGASWRTFSCRDRRSRLEAESRDPV